MRRGNDRVYRATNRSSRLLVMTTLFPCALTGLSTGACSDGSGVSSDQLDQSAALARKDGPRVPIRELVKLPHLAFPKLPPPITLGPKAPITPVPRPPITPGPKPPKTPGPKGGADAACPDPTLGSPGNRFIVGVTAGFVDRCMTTGCPNGPDASDVALDYGEFPFRDANFVVDGSFFYAVVAPGSEDDFLDGAPGNLSDTTASASPGDRGSGDTQADRTITSNAMSPVLVPGTHGTHAISFPPSQFEAIQLMPFDVPPDGHCELAICPTGATSRCDCAFAKFDVHPLELDGGMPGDGGAGGATGTGGHTSTGGAMSTGGAPESAGGTTHAAGGSAPCNN